MEAETRTMLLSDGSLAFKHTLFVLPPLLIPGYESPMFQCYIDSRDRWRKQSDSLDALLDAATYLFDRLYAFERNMANNKSRNPNNTSIKIFDLSGVAPAWQIVVTADASDAPLWSLALDDDPTCWGATDQDLRSAFRRLGRRLAPVAAIMAPVNAVIDKPPSAETASPGRLDIAQTLQLEISRINREIETANQQIAELRDHQHQLEQERDGVHTTLTTYQRLARPVR